MKKKPLKFTKGQIIKTNTMNLQITECRESDKKYKFKCNMCGFDCGEHYFRGKYEAEAWIVEKQIMKAITEPKVGRTGCSCCSNRRIVPEINSIIANEETRWMESYFCNKEDAKKYSAKSNFEVEVQCPTCEDEEKKCKLLKISTLYTAHSIGCPNCRNGYGYPNSLMYQVLEALKIKFKKEESFDWCKFKKFNSEEMKSGKYDFWIPEMNIIIEMDGYPSHFTPEGEYNDSMKDKLAIENLGAEIIRIPIKKNEFNLKGLKKLIIESLSSKFPDVKDVNWLKCDLKAHKVINKEIIKYYKKHPTESSADIAKKFDVSQITVSRVLQSYRTPKEVKEIADKKRRQYNETRRNQPILIYRECDNEFIDEKLSIAKTADYLKNELKVKLSISQISRYSLSEKPIKGYILKRGKNEKLQKIKAKTKIQKPLNWNKVMHDVKNKKITNEKAMKILGLKKSTYYELKKSNKN